MWNRPIVSQIRLLRSCFDLGRQILCNRAAGFDVLFLTAFVLASIALGTLMGASIYRWLTERFGAWQLQLGRAGADFRRKMNR